MECMTGRRDDVARRILEVCSELKDDATRVGLHGLALILKLAILEAENRSPPRAPPN